MSLYPGMQTALTTAAIRRLNSRTEANHSKCDAKPPTFIYVVRVLICVEYANSGITAAVTPINRPKLCFINVNMPKATANVISSDEQTEINIEVKSVERSVLCHAKPYSCGNFLPKRLF